MGAEHAGPGREDLMLRGALEARCSALSSHYTLSNSSIQSTYVPVPGSEDTSVETQIKTPALLELTF